MCFISPKNVERKLGNKEKKRNSKDSVTNLFFTADILSYHYFFRSFAEK